MNEAEQDLKDLLEIWEGDPSGEAAFRLEPRLYEMMRANGPAAVVAWIVDLNPVPDGDIDADFDEKRFEIRLIRADGICLDIRGELDDELSWVDARPMPVLDSDAGEASSSRDEVHEDPRHVAFYAVWEQVMDRGDDPAAVTADERVIYCMAELEAQIMNGGFGQYLANTDGARLDEALSLLQQIGAGATRDLLARAAALADGLEDYDAAWDEHADAYAALDDAFAEAGEDLAGLTADFLKLV